MLQRTEPQNKLNVFLIDFTAWTKIIIIQSVTKNVTFLLVYM